MKKVGSSTRVRVSPIVPSHARYNKAMDDFVVHGCEQVLRFTQVDRWDDLSEAIKSQLSFNMGVVALGLNLSKADGFQALVDVRAGRTSMQSFRNHLNGLITSRNIQVDQTKIARPF